MTLLSTTTLNSTSVTVSVSATGYNYLYIYGSEVASSGDYLRLRFNSDTGNNYSSSFEQYFKNGSATGTTAPDYYWYANQSSFYTGSSTASSATANVVFMVHDPSSANNDKLIQQWNAGTNSTFADWSWGSGFYEASGAITSITFLCNSSLSGSVKIYGVK
jgi:phage terminase large subunit-like protein